MKILAVFDSPTMFRTIEHLLSREKLGVCHVQGYDAGLEFLKTNPKTNCVFCQLNMHPRNGIDFFTDSRRIQHITDGGGLPPVKFVFVSNSSVNDSLESKMRALLEPGLVDCINQPIQFVELYRCIKSLKLRETKTPFSSKKLDLSILQNSIDDLIAAVNRIDIRHHQLNSHLVELEEKHQALAAELATLKQPIQG